MAVYETQYQALESFDEEETDENDTPTLDSNVMIHVVPESTRWNHIENLDDFFARVYHYHQRGGFICMVVEDVMQLIQFVFVVIFSTFLIECVNYDVLFANVHYNDTHHKVTIPEAVRSFDQCLQRFDFAIVVCILVAMVFWIFRLLKVIYNIFKYTEIRSFYVNALRISAADLPNMTWHEVQRKLLEVQKKEQMCIHKQELSELDIYHRILRFKNYMIAMVNKSLLPLKFNIPIIGESAFLSIGLKYNLEFILFWGPWSPFENNWKLRDEYKHSHRRKQLAESLSQKILWLGIGNFVLSPLIFLWQILYSFFRYGELIKRQPGALGARRWSNYSRIYLRHFNELDHEFNARLNRGYKAANIYMNIFTSPLLIILAKNVAFFAGSVLAVLIALTVIDEDVLSVEHILTTMTVAGLIVTGCRVFIPEEQLVYSPEILMKNILAQIHYMPDNWKGNAHTYTVRNQFALLFQYKVIYIVEELFSPLVTPVILCFFMRHKSLEIVDFFRNFTVDVVGVGDVCSFAQMDIRKHGHPEWTQNTETDANQYHQAEDGKAELSLMHFHLTNPEWKPPDNCSMFINNVKEQAQKDLTSLSLLHHDMAPGMISSQLPSLSVGLMAPSVAVGGGLGYTSLASSIAAQSTMFQPSTHGLTPPHSTSGLTGGATVHNRLRGGISQHEGPIMSPNAGFLSSMNTSGSLHESSSIAYSLGQRPFYDEGTLELLSHDMSFSALYLHEHQFRKSRGLSGYDNVDDIRARSLWQRQDSNQTTLSPMPDIQETPQEEETEGEATHSKDDKVTKSV